MIINQRHIAISVDNIDKAIDFYCQLGAQFMSRDLEEGPFIEHLLKLPWVKLKTCKLRLIDGSRLEIMEFIEPHIKQRLIQKFFGFNSRNIVKNGLHHIAFTVSDIESAITIVKKHGGKIYSSPKIVTKNHSTNAVLAKHAYVIDPFRNLLHIAQDL